VPITIVPPAPALPGKYPFWSAIIEQQQGSVSVAANSTANVDIQPPSGETWLIWLSMDLNFVASGSYVAYKDYDGATERTHDRSYIGGSYVNFEPHLELCKILTNSLYARLTAKNTYSSSVTFYYGYSGFKLSKPIWKPKRLLNNPSKPWKRVPSQYPIPKEVEPLKKYIVDVYDHDLRKYRQAIILEKNTPLAIDERTGHVVERLTVICYVDRFIERVLKPYKEGTLDLKASGWKKYFDKWAEEGVLL